MADQLCEYCGIRTDHGHDPYNCRDKDNPWQEIAKLRQRISELEAERAPEPEGTRPDCNCDSMHRCDECGGCLHDGCFTLCALCHASAKADLDAIRRVAVGELDRGTVEERLEYIAEVAKLMLPSSIVGESPSSASEQVKPLCDHGRYPSEPCHQCQYESEPVRRLGIIANLGITRRGVDIPNVAATIRQIARDYFKSVLPSEGTGPTK